jgi:chromosome partitioning protein
VKTIALIAQKGGVGKTTLAVNLAVAAGMRTILFDLDQQESAVIWADRRKNDMPCVRPSFIFAIRASSSPGLFHS